MRAWERKGDRGWRKRDCTSSDYTCETAERHSVIIASNHGVHRELTTLAATHARARVSLVGQMRCDSHRERTAEGATSGQHICQQAPDISSPFPSAGGCSLSHPGGRHQHCGQGTPSMLMRLCAPLDHRDCRAFPTYCFRYTTLRNLASCVTASGGQEIFVGGMWVCAAVTHSNCTYYDVHTSRME